MLQVSAQAFQQVLAHPEYVCYNIPKKTGGVRTVEAPQGLLRALQGRLANYMQPFYTQHKLPCVHGFVKSFKNQPKCGVLTNATPHLNKPCVLNMDIKNFFDGISAKQVKKALQQPPFKMSNEVSTAIALLCTYNKKLPTGAPTSPVLSNIVFYWVDQSLMNLVDEVNKHKHNDDIAVTYTRYADDLTFSGSVNLVCAMQARIVEVLNYFGFEVNTKKTRLQKTFAAQWVTGIKVNDKPNISRLYIRNLRATLHNLQNNTAFDAVKKHLGHTTNKQPDWDDVLGMFNCIRSKIAWVGLVRGKTDDVYMKLKSNFELAERKILVAPKGR
jgi:RNA-directed DNA polymerase